MPSTFFSRLMIVKLADQYISISFLKDCFAASKTIFKETFIRNSRYMFDFKPPKLIIFKEIPFSKPTLVYIIWTPITSTKTVKKIIVKLTCSYSNLNIDLTTYSLTFTFNKISFVKCSIWVESYSSTIASAFAIYFSFITNAFMVRKGCNIMPFYRVRRRKRLVSKRFIFLVFKLDFSRCCKNQLRC